MTRVAFCGVGKLGLPCAMVMAKNHDVVGYDVSRWPYDVLASRVFPHPEAEAQEYLNTTTLRMVDSIDAAVAHGDLIFVAVQTPHGPEYEGSTRIPETRADFDYSYLKKAVSDITECAKRLNKKVVVCVISTVLPGTVNREIRPLLNEYVAFCYSPYFIAMSTVIPDFVNPEFVLLGADKGDEDAADIVREFYGTITKSPVRQMSVASAEATKVFYNTFISTKITLVNTYMQVCEATGANVDDVTEALCAATSRIISPKYMRAGLGDGGGCLPPGELIYCEHGVVPIEDIEPEDRVLGPDGMLHVVEDTYKRPYKGNLYRLETRGNIAAVFTPEHPVKVALDTRPTYMTGGVERRNNNYGHQTSEIGDCRVSDVTGDHYSVFPVVRDRSCADPTKDDYAIFGGYYLGDGCIIFDSKSGVAKTVRMCLNTTTKAGLVDEIIEAALRIHKTNPKVIRDDSRHSIRIEFHSREFCRLVDAQFGHGAESKRIPSWGIYGSDQHAIAIIRGLMRTDGSNGKKGFSFTSVSPQLIHGLSVLLRRFEIASSVRENWRNDEKRGRWWDGYALNVSNAVYIEKLSQILGVEAQHPMAGRKFEGTVFIDKGVFHHKVQEVAVVPYEGTVYNLNVRGVHAYVTTAGTVANCHPRDNIALSYVSDKLGFTYNIFDAIMKAREEQTAWLASFAVEEAKRAGLDRIVILGKAFKGGTNMVVGSPAVLLKNILAEHAWVKAGHEVRQWDPRVDVDETLFAWLTPAAFVVATDHSEFYSMKFPPNSVVIDPWGKMPDTAATKVIRVGRH